MEVDKLTASDGPLKIMNLSLKTFTQSMHISRYIRGGTVEWDILYNGFLHFEIVCANNNGKT